MNDAVASPELCARCRTIDLGKYFLSEASPGNVELGYFQDILRNEHCPLCKLVIQTLSFEASRYWEPGKYPREMCHLGRYGDSRAQGQPMLQAWFHSTTETLPEGVYGHSTTLGEIQLLEFAPHHSDVARSYKPVARLVGERANLSAVKSWRKDCENHPECNTPTLGLSTTNETLPLLLIDVKRMRLAECDWGSRYVALSYVWGRAKQYRSLRSNFKELLKDNSLLQIREKLSRVINDAIDFVTALGESYLWVDTLCIVQDDSDSKDTYVSRMDRVYGQALLTIIALSGHDANASLPGVVDGSRRPPHSPVQLGPFKLLAGLPSLASVEQSCTWSSRAWTFQEGLLSKRRLYFWDHQVYWQCASTSCAENTTKEIRDGKMALGSLNPLARNTGDDSRLQFFSYQSLGKMYSRRRSTYPSDALRAFGGVLSVVKNSFGWEFASALPETVFDLALLWRPMAGSRLKLEGSEPPPAASESGLPSCHLPTWCWTAWTGFIHWDAWRLDSKGLRRLVRGQSVGQREEVGHQDASRQLTDLAERMSYDRVLPLNTLVFDATSLSTNAYTLSAPLPESSWTLARPASHQFKNGLRDKIWVYNDSGHHCGTIGGLRSWHSSANFSYDFVLLSRSDQDEITQADVDGYRDRLPLEYYSAEEYYKEVFDTKYFEYKRWWALNILLIQWKGEIAERVGVGQMHADAWNSARQQTKTIVLR